MTLRARTESLFSDASATADRQSAADGVYKWAVLGLFWLIYFMNQADRQVLFSVFPLLQKELGLTDTALGLLGSTFFWVYALLVPVAGALGDRRSRKRIVFGSLLFWSAATFVSGLAPGFMLLVVFRSLTGAGEAFYYPAANSMISDFHGQPSRALAMGIHQTSVYLGIVVSGTLAGLVGQLYGWRAAFLSFGGIGVALAVLVVICLRDPARGAAEQLAAPVPVEPLWQRVRQAASTPTFWMLMFAFLCIKLVDAAYLAWMPTLLYRKFSLTLANAGFHATFWHNAGAVIGILTGGRVSDTLALRNVLARPAVQFGGLIVGAPFIYLLAVSNSPAAVYVGLGVFGVCRGLYDSNLFASLYEVVPPQRRATATGMMLCAAFLGGGCAPLLIGRMSALFPLASALSYTSIFYVVGAGFLLLDCALWFRRDAARMYTGLPAGMSGTGVKA